jgi:hypothetical protein
MRDATLAWLKEHGIARFESATFKPWADRYTKTKLWKAQKVIEILKFYSGMTLFDHQSTVITELLIIEDEEVNRETIQVEVAGWIMHEREMRARYFVSLHDAVRALQTDAELPERSTITADTSLDDIPF